MSDVAVAEAELEEAQAELDANPDSRPAQVDYEGKYSWYEEVLACAAEPQPLFHQAPPPDEAVA